MKSLIIYYSHTGNNKMLAEETAKKIGAEIVEVEETEARSHKRIVMDMLFNRYPEIKKIPQRVSEFDLVIFFSPIWMFGIASPLRTCIRTIRNQIKKYSFVSLSGGALGPNTRISKELVRRIGKNQAFLFDLNISNFLITEKKNDVNTTSAVRLEKDSKELDSLVSIVTGAVNGLKV